MKKGSIFVTTALVLTIILTIFSACSFDKFVKVTEGEYIPVNTGTDYHDNSGTRLIESITVDRNNETLEVHLTDGTVIQSSIISRVKKEWPSGCPANIGSTRMEVLDVEVDILTIGDIILNNPVLVRDCPQNPERVILREDGQIGGSGTACAGNDKCFHFKSST